ncbi:MAG TPA: outer membrane beta-barrel protein, partial [Gemmatimonadaceae bacterium]|nr:outer membrane beta-barrel protein [Gemmatimonadaceae bacterium]
AARPVQFGISAGATMPMGDYGDVAGMGYHAQGSAEIAPKGMPVSWRADLVYDRHSGKEDVVGPDATFSTLGMAVNAVYAFQGQSARPYLLGGLGMYRSGGEIDGTELEASTDFGINAGAGVRFNLGQIRSFAEVRLHNIMTEGSATRVIPITFGLVF